MKRDMNLIRRIAMATEALPPHHHLEKLEGVDGHTFAAHVEWMQDAGLVDARLMGGYPDKIALVLRLTWEGADFVDAARDESLWRRAMAKVVSSGVSFTFELLKEALKAEIKKYLPGLGEGA